MRAILHIGTEKTGSSSIQRFFHLNRSNLAEQCFHFMRCTGNENDRKLVAYTMGPGEYDGYHRENGIDSPDLKRKFEEALKVDITQELSHLPDSVRTVIFSSEHFHSVVNRPARIEKLRSLLDEHFDNYRIICYLRPQIEVCVSHYSTRLKTRATCSLEEHLNGCTPDNLYYNYCDLLNTWESMFPESDFLVRLFDRQELKKGDVVTDICDCIGIASEDFTPVGRINESVKPTGQEMLKAINTRFPYYIDGKGINKQKQQLTRVISSIYFGEGQKPPPDRARHIQSLFDESNEQLRSKWFPGRDALFTIDLSKYEKHDPVNQELVDFFIKFLDGLLIETDIHPKHVPPSKIDAVRDLALELEHSRLDAAYLLMEVAAYLRPNGKMIQKKLSEYKASLFSA